MIDSPYTTPHVADENRQAIFVVTASFDDHAESESITALQGDPRVGVVFFDSTSGQRLPIIRPGMNAPARGILEKRDRPSEATDAVSSTRSIRFSPDTTFQSRSFPMAEIGEPSDAFGSRDQGERGLVAPAPPVPYPNFHGDHSRPPFNSEFARHVRISRLGRQGMRLMNFHLGFFINTFSRPFRPVTAAGERSTFYGTAPMSRHWTAG